MPRTTGTEPRSKRPRSKKHNGNGEAEVQAFLDGLGARITAGDPSTIADCFSTPMYVVGDQMVRAISTREEIERFFSGAKESYNARGVTDTRADVVAIDWATDQLVIVTVRWPYLDDSGDEVGGESSTYVLRRGDEGKYEICVAVMRGEEGKH